MRYQSTQSNPSNHLPLAAVYLDGPSAIRDASRLGGFLTPNMIDAIASDFDTRLTPIIVRCGGCRFTAPAQDVTHLTAMITASGKDYVRDLSLPVLR